MKIFDYFREKQFPFLLVFPMHILFFTLLMFFYQDLFFSDLLIVYFFWFLFGGVGIEVGYHRYFSHNAFEASPALENFLAVLGIWGAQWSPVWWRSLHVLHHNEADRQGDPHTPQKGFFYSLINWYLVFDPKKVPLRNGKRLMRKPFLNFIHKHYLVLFWVPIAFTLLISPKYALIVFVAPALLSFWQENLINSICHSRFFPANYRNYKTKDESRNNLILGYLVWGAGFHNNHHHVPSTYSFARKSYEFDICRPVVFLLLLVDKSLGSASN